MVLECHHVTGTWNYILKVRLRNTAMLEAFLTQSSNQFPEFKEPKA